ncbi:MAG: hypothetical protein WCS87_13455 [Methylococcaceae bacterium]
MSDISLTSTLDYENLRLQGLAWLEKLAGSEWTDFNAHDPGITILEQVCYALTDLSYRINFNIEDLLSQNGADTYDSLYPDRQILVANPVTLLDLRKWVIDVDGVNNAWLEAVTAPEPPVFYLQKPVLATGSDVITLAGDPAASPLNVQGLYRVLIEKSVAQDRDSNAIVCEVAERLHAERSLGVDFDTIQVIATQAVVIEACIEIDPIANPDDVYVAILEKVAAYLSHTVTFYTLQERLAQGKAIDEIFDGPLLTHGFIDTEELLQLTRKKNLYVSDLIRKIMDVVGVRMVEFVVFKTGEQFNDTALILDADKTPTLDIDNSKLTLKKRQLPVQLDKISLTASYLSNQKTRYLRTAVSSITQLPQGHDRHVDRYYSLLEQFPKLYGIGASGLPSTASVQRLAQAKQLKAYLLFFDQVLANSFAQLAHLKDLFSFNNEQVVSYFAGCLDSPNISELWVEQDSSLRNDRLQQLFGATNPNESVPLFQRGRLEDWQRKHRFVDHLLARFAEQFSDYSRFTSKDGDLGKQVLSDKLALLRSYTQTGRSKGTGFNVLAENGQENCCGLEQQLRLKLGLNPTEGETLYLIEHGLLRPMAGDTLQQSALLCNARSQDPYSLQVSVVFYAAAWRTKDFESFVRQLLQEEMPAHLFVYVGRIERDDLDDFNSAYGAWRKQLMNYRMLSNQRSLNGQIDLSAAIPLRDARDRMIDLLGLGNTYPLRDLAIPDIGTVAYNISARIIIQNSQPQISYQLCDNNQHPLAPEIKQPGNGGDLELISPKIADDRNFTIQATKISSGLSNFLLQTPTVKVGLDLDLLASIQNAPLLIAGQSAADDARIVDYGVIIQVAIELAQEGVDYQLVNVSGQTETVLSAVVRGDSHSIVLKTLAFVTEDITIRLRATKTFEKSEKKKTQTDLLSTVLPLKVKANPKVSVSVLTPIIDYAGVVSIKVAESQASTRYQVFTRPIADSEFIRDDRKVSTLTIAVPNKAAVVIAIPDSGGFIIGNEGALQGNGSDLGLSCANLTADSFIEIQAVKTHLANDKTPVTSSVLISQIVAVLVRPDANPTLHFNAGVTNGLLQAPIQVSGGQAGVFYEFTTVTDNKVQGLPVYCHQSDHADNTQNKGVGQLQIGVDLVIPPDLSAARLAAHPNLTVLPPELPQLSAGVNIKSDAELSIRAYKAQTGVEVIFKRSVNELLK